MTAEARDALSTETARQPVAAWTLARDHHRLREAIAAGEIAAREGV